MSRRSLSLSRTDSLGSEKTQTSQSLSNSHWNGVYDLLKADGYRVRVVQNPTLSLEGDVAATRWVIDAQDAPVVLVGHSYAGAVITEAGTHPNVTALVYIAPAAVAALIHEAATAVSTRQ